MARTLTGAVKAAQQQYNLPPYVHVRLESGGTSMDLCDDTWTSDGGANVVCSADTTAGYRVEGSASAKMAIGSGFTTGNVAYENLDAAVDMSAHGYCALWIYSSVATNAGDLKILLYDTSPIANLLETIDVPALRADYMTRVHLKLSDAYLCTSVAAIRLYRNVNLGAQNIWIDDVRSVTAYKFASNDLTPRLLAVDGPEESYSGFPAIYLHNGEKYFSSLSLKGYKGWIGWGWDGAGQQHNYEETQPFYVYSQTGIYAANTQIIKLNCFVMWEKLNMHRVMGNTVAAPPFYEKDTALLTIIETLGSGHFVVKEDSCDDATPPGGAGICQTYQPFFISQANDKIAGHVARLIGMTLCAYRFDNAGILHAFYIPETATTSNHTYDDDYFFWSDMKGDAVVIPNRVIYTETPPTEQVTPTWSGTANDTTSQATAVGIITQLYSDPTVVSNAEALARATSELHRLKLSVDHGRFIAPMNADMELFDYVTVTNTKTGTSTTGRVGYMRRIYDPLGIINDRSIAHPYYIEVQLGNVTRETYETQNIQKSGMIWVSLFDGSVDTPTAQDWEYSGDLPFTMTGSLGFSPVLYDSSTNEQYIYVIDRSAAQFWKFNVTHPQWIKLTDPPSAGTNANRMIVPDGADSNVLYTIGTSRTTISKYSISTNTWTEGTAVPYESPSMAVSNRVGGNFTAGDTVTGSVTTATGEIISDSGTVVHVVQLTDIEFTTADSLDNGGGKTCDVDTVANGEQYAITSFVWYAADDIRCWVNYSTDDFRCIKYDYTADTWTVASSTKVTGTTGLSGHPAAAKTNVIYVGWLGDAITAWSTYTISTDTYSLNAGDITGGTQFTETYDRDKLWYNKQATGGGLGYMDTSDDSNNGEQFAANDLISLGSTWINAVNDAGTSAVSMENSVTPRIFSLTRGGSYALVEDVQFYVDSHVRIKKPSDDFPVLILNSEGYSKNVYELDEFIVPPGLWSFYYPQDGDYTQIIIEHGYDSNMVSADTIPWEYPMPQPQTVIRAPSTYSESDLVWGKQEALKPSKQDYTMTWMLSPSGEFVQVPMAPYWWTK